MVIKTLPAIVIITIFCTISTFENFAKGNPLKAREYIIATGAEDYPPYEFVEDGKLTGFHIELIQVIASRHSLNIKFERYPFKRAQELLKLGKIDAFTYYGRTVEREEYTHYLKGNILHEATIGFLTKNAPEQKISFDGSLKKLSRYRILTQAGFTYGKEFDKATYLRKHSVPTLKQLIDMLLKDRADLGIVYLSDYYAAYKGSSVLESISILTPLVFKRPMYIGFSKAAKTEEISTFFSKKMIEFKKTKAYKALHSKYF